MAKNEDRTMMTKTNGEGNRNAYIGDDDVGSNKYSYQERILLSPNVAVGFGGDGSVNTSEISSWDIRLETSSSWTNETWMHPFSPSIQGLLENFPQVSRILIQSSNLPSNTASSSRVSTSSPAASLLDDVPILGAGDGGSSSKRWSPPPNRGPSGVFIHVHVRKDGEEGVRGEDDVDKSKLVSSIITELVERRLVVAPVGSSKYYDILSSEISDDHGWMFQIMLPTDGSQMSADAIEQSFVSFTPASCKISSSGGSGILSHSTILSDIFLGEHKLLHMKETLTSRSNNLLSGSSSRRTMWLDITSSTTANKNSGHHWKLSQGVQYALPHIKSITSLDKWSSWILPGMDSNNSSNGNKIEPCPLVTTDGSLAVQIVVPAHRSHTTNDDGNGGGYKLLPTSKQEDNASILLNEESILSSYDLDVASPRLSVYKVARRPYGISNRGRLETTVVNDSDNNGGLVSGCVAQISLREIVPSFVTPKWRSLQATVTTKTKDDDVETNIKIQPNVEFRTMPSILGGIKDDNVHSMKQQDAIVTVDTYLPPKSSLLVSLDYDPAFLTFEEFPGDPNRGMEVTPSIVTFKCIDEALDDFASNKNYFQTGPTDSGNYQQMYSNTLLILPPVPDMSMPFNVTSLTCSIFAYVVGSMIALLVKKSNEKIKYKLYPDQIPKSKLKLLRERIKDKITSTLFRKKEVKSIEEEESGKEEELSEHKNPRPGTDNDEKDKGDNS